MNLELKQKPDAYDFVYKRLFYVGRLQKLPWQWTVMAHKKYYMFYILNLLNLYIIHYSLRINIVFIKYYNVTNSYDIYIYNMVSVNILTYKIT